MEDQYFYIEDEVECSENCSVIEEYKKGIDERDKQIIELLNILDIHNERTEIFRSALKVYGEFAQINMVFEEMAELQKELCKYLRGNEPKEQIIRIAEEIADVEVMLEQMKLLFNLHKAVESHKEYKISRLKHRLDKEGEVHE